MTASEALDRWSAAHEHLASKEIAMHSAQAKVDRGETSPDVLEALQAEVLHLRHHSDSMLAIALEMLRMEKAALAREQSDGN
jgi:hypothetical protein